MRPRTDAHCASLPATAWELGELCRWTERWRNSEVLLATEGAWGGPVRIVHKLRQSTRLAAFVYLRNFPWKVGRVPP